VTAFAARNDEPTPLEKTTQLERILVSATFQRFPKPSRFLQFLVDSDLAGRTLDEDTVGVEFFERRKKWVPLDDAIVRENLRRLRNLLQAYYAEEGIEDRLNLQLSGFKPVFSYNVRNPVERSFRRALRYVRTDPSTAFSLLDATLSMQPDHAEALAARAETELWRPMYGNEIDIPNLLHVVEVQAQESLRYDDKCWRAYVVMGALHCCRKQWDMAADSFNLALKSLSAATSAHPWYAAFLMAIGRTKEALDLTKARANEPSATPSPMLTHAVFLYAARKFAQAERVILTAKKEYEDTWLSHALWSCVSQGTQKSVPLLGMSLPQSLPDGTVVYTGLCILETLRRLSPDGPDYPSVKLELGKWVQGKLAVWESPTYDDSEPFAERRVSPFHLAIGCMAMDDNQKAIELLAIDFERDHPLMVWMHLWPLLDPLREDAQFKRLIKRMNLPSGT
jgi:tetratricopeptide (TPR) repeat protein